VSVTPDGAPSTGRGSPASGSAAQRIFAVDVLRGVAVLGILLINIEDFGLPHADKTAAGTEWVGTYLPADFSHRDVLLWTLARALFEGKLRAIFSMLFGAGVILLTSRVEGRGEGARVADIYYRRTLWLLAFGVLHAYLLWEGDILYGYAVSGLFLFPFRRLSPRLLIGLGGLVLALSVPRAAAVAVHREEVRSEASAAITDGSAGKALTQRQKDAEGEWAEVVDAFEPDPVTIAETRADYHGGYARLFARRAPLVMEVESSDFYSWAFFDTVGMMLIGMGLLRLGVLTGARSSRFYVAMAVAGFAVGLPLSGGFTYAEYLHRFDPVAIAWLTMAYEPGRLAVAAGLIAVVMLFVRRGTAPPLARALADVGRMALTNYLTTTVICTTLFNGYGFGLFGALGRAKLYGVVLLVWCIQLVWSRLWLATFRMGPAEWVWRSLTYWRAQPLRRGQADLEVAP
jgi:uncharacterized protein